MKKFMFNPLLFLASLGAGGISVIPFAFFQYTHHTGAGLIDISKMSYNTLSLGQTILFRSLEVVMILFVILHIVLTIKLLAKLIVWRTTPEAKNMLADPLRNAAILAPFISITMTMNVFIGPIRYFFPSFAANLQTFMLPALITWSIIFFWLMSTEIKLLHTSFVKGFDISKINFGWLLHPFALGMITVTGTGIAAMSKNVAIANTAAFFSMISFTMGMFLLLVKLVVIFKSHFAAKGLPEKNFLPSFLIVIPNITLFAISAFRFGHFLENHHAMHLGAYFYIVMGLAFAFEIWYMLFGLSLMKDFFKKHYFKKEFYATQWGLICPFVAFAVLGSFVYKIVLASPIIYWLVIITTLVAVIMYLDLLTKQMTCKGILKRKNIKC